jgi:superfamily II DNA/RNA helicase
MWHNFYRSSNMSMRTHWVNASSGDERDKRVQLAGEVLPLVFHGLTDSDRKFRVLVFCDTSKRAGEVAGFLKERGWPTSTTISAVAPEDLEIVCVTDAASRGVDWHGVQAVVNFNAPGDVQTFLHRAGRLDGVRGFRSVGGDSCRGVGVTMMTGEAEKSRMKELQRLVDEEDKAKLHVLFSTRRSLRKKIAETR